jgi:hypothetical protein
MSVLNTTSTRTPPGIAGGQQAPRKAPKIAVPGGAKNTKSKKNKSTSSKKTQAPKLPGNSLTTGIVDPAMQRQVLDAQAQYDASIQKQMRDNTAAGQQAGLQMRSIARDYSTKNNDARLGAGARNLALSPATMMAAAKRLYDAETGERAQVTGSVAQVRQDGLNATNLAQTQLFRAVQAAMEAQARNVGEYQVGRFNGVMR